MSEVNKTAKIQYANDTLETMYQEKGGLIDCHRHLDRHNTLDEYGYSLLANNASLEKKWEYIDLIKSGFPYLKTIEGRMRGAVLDMMFQGIKACRTYIDVDEIVKLKGIEAAIAAKKYGEENGFILQIAAYPVRGLDTPERLAIFEASLELSDLIGALPSRGRSSLDDNDTVRKNMNILFGFAYKYDKPIDLQIDQKHNPFENECSVLCEVAENYRNKGYIQNTTATHAISLETRSLGEIRAIAKKFRELGISVVVCPGTAISTKQETGNAENLSVAETRIVRLFNSILRKRGLGKVYIDGRQIGFVRNAIAPIRELLDEGVNVALGTDNVSDIFMSFCSGDFRTEINKLADAIRWQNDIKTLADMATINGRRALGLPLAETTEG